MERQLTSTVHCDLEGKITFMSKGAKEIFQYDPEELLEKERVSVFSPGLVVLEHVPGWLKRSVSEGHFETETVFIRKDGSKFPAHIRITPIMKDGVHTGYIGLTTPLEGRSVDEVMPKISRLTKVLSWLYITRAPFLTVTIVSVLLGAILAPWLVSGAEINVGLLLLTLLGASLAHLGVNTANDYFDSRSGVDDLNANYVIPYSGGSRMIQLGVISVQGMLKTSVFLFALAAIVGVYLATELQIWPQVLILAVLGGAIGFLYTAPYINLAGRGFGEIGIILAFGPLLVGGATLIQTTTIEPLALMAGIPAGLLTGLIVWVNEFPDFEGDAKGGKRTMVVRLGLERSRFVYVALWSLSYIALLGLVFIESLPQYALLGLLTLPLALYVSRQLFSNYKSRAIKNVMAGTIYLHFFTGLLMIIGVGLSN